MHTLKAQWAPYRLYFKFEARTSRQTMLWKDTFLVRVFSTDSPEKAAIGECALFRGLSADDKPDFEQHLADACANPASVQTSETYSAVRFGFESAMYRLNELNSKSKWSRGLVGIPTNGLIWMGDKATMTERVAAKLDEGYKVLKLKIGGINFEDELDILRQIRKTFSSDVLEIRLDANGAFSPAEALGRLEILAKFGIHSIEQPIRAGQIEDMAAICGSSPIPIALDEELIGWRSKSEAAALLDAVKPAYIILKPSLCGGFAKADEYISLAQERNIGWWATSALESNVGLEAIARWLTDKHEIAMPQGLGTGALYTNNFEAPIVMRNCGLYFLPEGKWHDFNELPWRN